MHSHKLSACVSPSCVVCKGFGEQVVCVMNMPWTKCLVEMCLFRVAVLTAETPLELDVTGAAGMRPPKVGHALLWVWLRLTGTQKAPV